MNKKLPINTFIGVIAATGCSTAAVIAQPPENLGANTVPVDILVNNSLALEHPQSVKLSQLNIRSRPQSGQSPNSSDNLTKALIVLGMITTLGVLGVGLFRYRRSPRSSLGLPLNGNQRKKALIDRVSPQLRKRLLRLINDPKTANRLLLGIQKDHGDRSPNWLAEKAIYDLRRGR